LSNPAAKPTGFLKVNPKTVRSKRLSFTLYIPLKRLDIKGILQSVRINEKVK
jgi:hypothetical protein